MDTPPRADVLLEDVETTSQRQLQSHLNDNYTYRLTTITRAVNSGFVLCAVEGAKPLTLLPLGGGVNSF